MFNAYAIYTAIDFIRLLFLIGNKCGGEKERGKQILWCKLCYAIRSIAVFSWFIKVLSFRSISIAWFDDCMALTPHKNKKRSLMEKKKCLSVEFSDFSCKLISRLNIFAGSLPSLRELPFSPWASLVSVVFSSLHALPSFPLCPFREIPFIYSGQTKSWTQKMSAEQN